MRAATRVVVGTLVASMSVWLQGPGESTLPVQAQIRQGPVRPRFPSPVADIRTEELICRGGPALAFQTVSGGATVIMELNIVAAREPGGFLVPAGDFGEGLHPATCSFAQRGMNGGDPSRIRFETAPRASVSPERDSKQAQHGSASPRPSAATRPDQETIPAYLTDPSHYWVFSVYRTNMGHLYATKHGPWEPKTAATMTNARTPAAGSVPAIGRLTDVQVYPELAGVGFRFIARPNAAPVIELDNEPSIIGRDGLAVFRNPARMRADRDNRNSTGTVTFYVGSSTAQRVKLDQGAAYHYLITVPGDGVFPTQQAAGEFTTLAQTITAYFSHIHVLNDSDDDSSGEMDFHFYAGDAADPNRWSTAPKVYFDVESGERRRIEGRIVLKAAPERLLVQVNGYEDDVGFPAQGKYMPSPFDTPRKWDGFVEINVARAVFDMNSPELRGKNVNRPFVLRAGLGPHGSQLVFDVMGSIEITRPQ